jgi:hypothetical protein
MKFHGWKALACLAAGGAALLVASRVQASDEQHVVVLGAGTNGDAIAQSVASHLTPPYSSIDAGSFRGALGPALRQVPVAAKRRDKDAAFIAHARAAQRSAHADRAVVVYAEKSKKGLLVHVWAIDAQGTGASPVDTDVHLAAGASTSEAGDAAWDVVATQFFPAETSPPPASSAEPAPSVATPAPASQGPAAEGEASTRPQEPATTSSAVTRATSIALLEAAMQAGTRHFEYVDRLTPSLRPYDLFVAPMVAVHGEAYPFVNTHLPVLGGLGAAGSYARAFALSSKDSAGHEVGTSWQSFDLGLRERIGIGESFLLTVQLGYGSNAFSFDTPVATGTTLPSAQYKFLRGGLDGRFVHGALSVHAGASYLDVLSTGDFGTLFPRTTVSGIDATVGASYAIAPRIELSLDVVYTRFFYSLLPVPGDPYVAGGALDQMGTVSLGVGYLF